MSVLAQTRNDTGGSICNRKTALLHPRRPLVLLCLAFIAGIVCAKTFSWTITGWLALLWLALASVLALSRFLSVRKSTVGLLISTSILGACWMHSCLLFGENDIGCFVNGESQLCRLRAMVSDTRPREPSAQPWVKNPEPAWTITLQVQQLRDRNEWRSVTGNLVVYTSGTTLPCAVGDLVEVTGWLAKPADPLNPGEFDLSNHLLRQRIRAVLFAESTDAFVLLETSKSWSLDSLSRLQDFASRKLTKRLNPELAGIAEATLIGQRGNLDRESLRPFLESGTMHLLVVSGIHLVVIAWAIWMVGNLLGIEPEQRSLVVLLLIWLYAAVTGCQSPVVRAAVISSLYLLSFNLKRPHDALNSLAGAALLVLLWDPWNLFRGGPQLSFLAVLAIFLLHHAPNRMTEVDDELVSWSQRLLQRTGNWLVQAAWFSTVIWLCVTPLLIHRFHLFTPISILLSVALIPVLFAVLLLGMLLLVIPESTPVVPHVLSDLLYFPLQLLHWVVNSIDRHGWGSVFAPGLNGWWLAGLYFLVLVPPLFGRIRVFRVWQLASVVAYVVLGVLFTGRQVATGLNVHQLAVGHGNCAVVRFPDGQTLMYDCGSLRGDGVAERTIAPWLWYHHIGHIDALVLSHADVDHFSGVEQLLRRFPIRCVYVSPHFVQSDEPKVRQLLAHLQEHDVAIRFLWSGDQFRSGGCLFEVLGPNADSLHPSDNSASIKALVSCRGTRLLFTGDIEKQGLLDLLHDDGMDCDILIAPHHGSLSSNTLELADHLRPRVVIVSQGNADTSETLQHIYAEAEIFETSSDGEIRCVWDNEGVTVSGFYSGRRFRLRP